MPEGQPNEVPVPEFDAPRPLAAQEAEESAPSEGDVLRAALAAHGFPAYSDSEGGVSWLAVPLDAATAELETYDGPHFRISSGEHADRPVSHHDEPWGVSFFDGNGDYITTLDGAPHGSSLAEDSAYAAHAVAEYAKRHAARH